MKKQRPYQMYRASTFFDIYRLGLVGTSCGRDVMDRRRRAIFAGQEWFIVYDDEMQEIEESLNEFIEHLNKRQVSYGNKGQDRIARNSDERKGS